MKVLHLISGNLAAGAARGAYWLHQALLNQGLESRILTNAKNIYADPTITSLADSTSGFMLQYSRMLLDHFFPLIKGYRKQHIFSTGLFGYDFRQTKAYQEADILHLHWINKGFINIKHLHNIDKPIIWTMRDMWPATGGCHYALDCTQYQTGCGCCPQLKSTSENDLSRIVYNNKKQALPDQLTIVGISNWLTGIAKSSKLFATKRCVTIPNTINTRLFYPVDKTDARKQLGITTGKRILLIGANDVKYFSKGYDLLLDTLKNLDDSNIHLVSFGKAFDLPETIRNAHTSLGFINDDEKLRLIYAMADVFVVASRQEAFGKTLAEALACGTPVVCFDATGPRDIVDHKVNGYKAKPFETDDLAKGVNWVLQQQDSLSDNCVAKVKQSFDTKIIATQYQHLYEKLLSEFHGDVTS